MKSDALIILDWDDTLFPTTWTVKNRINLSDKDTKERYIVYFSQLDNLLYKLLSAFMEHGTIFVVTNAMVKWVLVSADILPHTKRLLQSKIQIISAREKHGKEIPNDMFEWKRLIFKNLVSKYYLDNSSQNIISVGDADYEFRALVDLWNKHHKRRILKTVKFMPSPSFDALIDQLEVLASSVPHICKTTKHMDLRFNDVRDKVKGY